MFSVRVGLDLEDLARWHLEMAVIRRRGRVFTATEYADCMRHANPVPHFAARWCAKEAAVKALSPATKISIFSTETVLRDGVPRLSRRDGGTWPETVLDVQVSLTHTMTTAGAIVVVLQRAV